METLEYVVWSVMLGGLLTIGTMAVADVFISRTLAAWRGLLFMSVTGFSCVLLSGLPEELFPGLPTVPVLVLKCSLGPLSGAMVLTYLRLWLGTAAEDRYVHNTIQWGSGTLLMAAMLITLLCTLFASTHSAEILLFAAFLNGVAVLLATFTSVRAAQLGDKLARTMVLGCLLLALSLGGLFARQLVPDSGALPVWIGTSFSTVVFFLVMVSLGISRNRQVRRLERLAGLSLGMDPATGLPRGSVLLSKVDDAFWRSARLNTHCAVICLHLRNLYELSEVAGHSVDQQILSAMAARIRRAMGFRCVVGLYHPRCFVVVLSAVKQPKLIPKMTDRLREVMVQPLDVVGSNDAVHRFLPQLSVGHVTVNSADLVPADVIDEAEQIALQVDRDTHRADRTAQAPVQVDG